jgi:hypothetical protein
MNPFQKLLSLASCLVIGILAMLALSTALTPSASASSLAVVGPQLTVTGVVHVTETNANGDVMNYTVTPAGGTAVKINVEPPNSGATADINSHEGESVTAKYHTTGTPKRNVHDGFLT